MNVPFLVADWVAIGGFFTIMVPLITTSIVTIIGALQRQGFKDQQDVVIAQNSQQLAKIEEVHTAVNSGATEVRAALATATAEVAEGAARERDVASQRLAEERNKGNNS